MLAMAANRAALNPTYSNQGALADVRASESKLVQEAVSTVLGARGPKDAAELQPNEVKEFKRLDEGGLALAGKGPNGGPIQDR